MDVEDDVLGVAKEADDAKMTTDVEPKADRAAAEDDGSGDSSAEDGGPGAHPKHRFAVFFGYVGAAYQGLQK